MKLQILWRPPWAFWYTKLGVGWIAHVGPLFISWGHLWNHLTREPYETYVNESCAPGCNCPWGDHK
jgi:hypothetical protein